MIIGAMKAGTTSLFGMLSQHPQIVPSKVKEPQFFMHDHNGDLHNQPTFASYRELWPETITIKDPVLLEASTGYTKLPSKPGVAQRIFEAGLRPKFIYCVRNPIDRIESQYNFSMGFKWFEPSEPISAAKYFSYSMYFTQLSPYIRLFGADSIQIVDFDAIQSNPYDTCQELARFLNVSGDFSDITTTAGNVTPPITKREKIVYESPILASTYWRLPHGLRNTIRNEILRRSSMASRTVLTAEQRKSVREVLSDDIRNFGEVFDFPIEKWGFE